MQKNTYKSLKIDYVASAEKVPAGAVFMGFSEREGVRVVVPGVVEKCVVSEAVSGKEVREREGGGERIEIGLSKERSEVTPREVQLLIRKIVREALAQKVAHIALAFDDLIFEHVSVSRLNLAQKIGENITLAHYSFDTYKTVCADKKSGKSKGGTKITQESTEGVLSRITLVGDISTEEKKALARGILIGEEVNACRELANTPGIDMTPTILANAMKQAVKGLPVKLTIWGEVEMNKRGFGAVLAVSQGSTEEAQFIQLAYYGGKKGARPVVLAGKGVTYDSGGLSIKPSSAMNEMHMDMTGGAVALQTVILAAKLALPVNVIALVPAVENMPSGSSVRPGDIVKSYSGVMIDIVDTDAEGRVILADALAYASELNPTLVIDIATLTGASLIALGTVASAIMTRDSATAQRLLTLSEECGEYVWPFPLWDEYKPMIKSTFGDVANVPTGAGARWAGVIGGGMFLEHFTKDYSSDCPFVHMDIAPRMESAESDNLAKGATGEPMRLLARVLEAFCLGS